ncbi:Pentatricopeptide repeat-containing protein At3g48250, chloroplastic [Linum grandiflorum]
MLRGQSILSTIKISRILHSARHSSAQPLVHQVTSSNQFDSQCFNVHQKLHLSSKSNSMLELLLENDWSAELHNQLESFDSPITHETIVYVLRKLDQVPDNAWGFYNWVRKRDGYLPSSSLYSLLLRLFAKKDSMKKFWITLRKMREEGFCLDEETYLTLSRVFKKERMNGDAVALKQFYEKMIQENAVDGVVKKVVEVIVKEGEEEDDKVENRLTEMKIVLSDNFVIRSLKELKSQPLKALRFFRWVATCEGYKHNTVTYNAMARVLGREDTIVHFWSIVEEMKRAGFEIDIDTYIKISRHFQKYKLTEEAVKLYEFMMEGPFKPSVQDCSLLLRNMSSSRKLDLSLVFRVVHKFEASGNVVSKAVYDGMHRSFVNAGSFDEAEKIVKAMKDAGYEPDNITYSQLVFGLCKAGRLDEACKMLDEMETEGCTPDIKTWTILIQGHCDAGELGKALMCFDTMMRKNGESPDADLVDVLMKGFVSEKRVDGAYVFLVEMINKGRVRPWQATYKLLIDSLLGASKLQEAMSLLRLMKKHNYPPHAETLVEYISKFGSVQDAAELLQALSSKQYPSLGAYQNVFESFFKEGRHSEAQDLLYKCPYHVRQHQQIGQLFGSSKNGAAATLANNTVT